MLFYLSLLVALICLIVRVGYNVYQLDSSIPGPWLSAITRLWFFVKVRTGSFHLLNVDLHRRYGPIVRVAPGHYSISSLDKTVYGIGSKFAKGDWYQGWKHPSPDRWTMFPDQDIKRHAETRKRFQGLYSMSSLLSYESYVDECTDIFLDKFTHFAGTGQTIDLAHWFQCYAFDVMGEITYSERFGFLDAGEDIQGTIRALDKSMVYSTLVGIYPRLHPFLYALMEKVPGSGAAGRTFLMRFVQKKVDERNATRVGGDGKGRGVYEDGTPQDFLEKLTLAREQNPDKVTPYHIFMMGLSNIIAGSDTTAVSLSSVLYRLIVSPRALSKLRHEIRAHKQSIDKSRFSFKESQEMPYLQAVIKEALRLHPATGLPLWRVVPEGGAEVCGHWFPAGTKVGVNSWVAHYDESVFGDEAAEFRPERWLEAEENDAGRFQRMNQNWMPVSARSLADT